MALSKSLAAFVNKAKRSDAYWVEKAKLNFSLALERWRRASGLSNKQLAEKIDTSPAYITKVFRGDTNFTIETMVKLARACNGQLDIRIVDEAIDASRWAEHAKVALPPRASDHWWRVHTVNATTSLAKQTPANHHEFDLDRIAA